MLLVQKQDAHFVYLRANHHFVLEDMTRASAISKAIYQKMDIYQLLFYLQDLLILKIIRASLYPMNFFLKKYFWRFTNC